MWTSVSSDDRWHGAELRELINMALLSHRTLKSYIEHTSEVTGPHVEHSLVTNKRLTYILLIFRYGMILSIQNRG